MICDKINEHTRERGRLSLQVAVKIVVRVLISA